MEIQGRCEITTTLNFCIVDEQWRVNILKCATEKQVWYINRCHLVQDKFTALSVFHFRASLTSRGTFLQPLLKINVLYFAITNLATVVKYDCWYEPYINTYTRVQNESVKQYVKGDTYTVSWWRGKAAWWTCTIRISLWLTAIPIFFCFPLCLGKSSRIIIWNISWWPRSKWFRIQLSWPSPSRIRRY